MYRILYILSTVNKRGPVIVLLNIIKYLDREKFEPYIITLSPNDPNSLFKELEKYTKKIITLDLSRIEGLFKVKSIIRKNISIINPHIIHTHGIRSDHLNAEIRSSAKTVATLHNYPYHDYTLTYGRLKGFLMAIRHLEKLRQLDQPVVVSKFIQSMLKDSFSGFKVIQNGIDASIFKKADLNEKQALRKKLKIATKQKVFIVTGHLSERKNPLTIIKAFKNARLENSILVFCGDGELESVCKSFEEENRIVFMGRVQNVTEFLKAADYFISASKAEGLPNAVLEAMACGLPVILSKIEPHTEIFQDSADYEYFFEPNADDQLKELLKQIINSNYVKLSELAREIVYTNFTAEIMSNKYQKLYLEILD